MQTSITDTKQSREMITGGTGKSIPPPDKARFSLWQASSQTGTLPWITVSDIQTSSDSGASSGGFPPGPNPMNHFVNLNGLQNRSYHGQNFVWPGRNASFKSAVYLDFNGNPSSKFYIGLSSVITAATDPTSVDSIVIGSIKATGLGWSDWFVICSVGGVITSVNTKMPVVNLARNKLEFTLNNGIVTATINNKVVAQINTNIPTIALAINWWLQGTDGANVGTSFTYTEFMYAENSTPS